MLMPRRKEIKYYTCDVIDAYIKERYLRHSAKFWAPFRIIPNEVSTSDSASHISFQPQSLFVKKSLTYPLVSLSFVLLKNSERYDVVQSLTPLNGLGIKPPMCG
jgi:hypothetical protein